MFLIEELPQYASDWWFRLGLNYPAVCAFAVFAAFAYGACLGSFMNVCIWRMPRGESVVNAPSHCTKCGAHIRWYDNLPVISYLVLRGRCRSCHAPYSPRYFAVEVLCGALFVAVFPGNVSQWLTGTDGFGLDTDGSRAVRLVFQPLLVAWALWCTGAWGLLLSLLGRRDGARDRR